MLRRQEPRIVRAPAKHGRKREAFIMPRAKDLLNEKLREGRNGVAWTTPLATVTEAAKRMNDWRIGALVVLDDEEHLAGIVTERDVLMRVVAKERNPSATRVGDVMTRAVFTCSLETRLDDLREVMREKRIRHVPIVEDTRVIGMVSIGDLNTIESRIMSETICYLEQYMHAS